MRIAINGFGRIGRLILRSIIENDFDDIQLVGINDLSNTKSLAQLLKFDSVHGPFPSVIEFTESGFRIKDHDISVFNSKNPESLPWG